MMEIAFSVITSTLLLGLVLSSDGAPSIPVTFTAKGEVERHLPEETRFGQFEIGVNADSKMGYQIESYELGGGRMEANMVFHLTNTTCYVRNKVCVNETRDPKETPNFWKWLGNATYEGDITIRHITYDFWGYNVGGLRLELAVEKNQKKNKPAYFNRKTAEETINYGFLDFNPDVAPGRNDSIYLVPKYCWGK